MKKYFKKYKDQKGYAILFTIVVVSAVSVITAGLTNATYKQLVLSSLARDSQEAFYQSDTASDCALYADRVKKATNPEMFNTNGTPWTCGNLSLTITQIPTGGYTIYPQDLTSKDPCFRIDVAKDTTTPGTTATTVKAKGYNICRTDSPRTVEREIEIKYQEQP